MGQMERVFNRGVIGPDQKDTEECNQVQTDAAYLQRQKWIGRITWGAAALVGVPTSIALTGCSTVLPEPSPTQIAMATSTPTAVIEQTPTSTPEPQRTFKRTELSQVLIRVDDLLHVGDRFIRKPFGAFLFGTAADLPAEHLANITDQINPAETTAAIRYNFANDPQGQDSLFKMEVKNYYENNQLVRSSIMHQLELNKNEEVKGLVIVLLDEEGRVAKDKLYTFINALYVLPKEMIWKTFTIPDKNGKPVDVIKAVGMSTFGVTYVVEADSTGGASLEITIPTSAKSENSGGLFME